MKTSNKILTSTLGIIVASILILAVGARWAMDVFEKNKIQGNGVSKTEVRKVDRFTSLNVGNGIEVELFRGENALEITTDENLLEHIITTVEDGRLEIFWKKGSYLSSESKVTAKVSMLNIESLNVNSAALVKSRDALVGDQVQFNLSSGGKAVLGTLETNSFSADLSSNAKLHFQDSVRFSDGRINNSSGAALIFQDLQSTTLDVGLSSNARVELAGGGTSLQVNTSSGGRFSGENYRVETARLEGSSGGQIRLTCTQNLNGNLSSGAQIHYRGEALVNVDKSSGGGVHKLD